MAIWMRASVVAIALLAVVKPLASAAFGVWRCDFQVDSMSRAIDASLQPIGVGLLLLAALS